MISKETWPGRKGVDPKSESQKILKAFRVSDQEFRFGKTKVFIRNPTTLFMLEGHREKAMPWIVTIMQKAWRGYACRRQWNKMKASVQIQLFYRRYRFRKYFFDLKKTFQNVAQDPQYGKTTRWPNHGPVLDAGVNMLQRVHENWRAKMMILSLSPEDQAEMRQKVLAYSIFHGKKPWNCSRRYLADYLQLESNPNQQKYIAVSTTLFSTYGDTQVMFADYVWKVNHNHKTQKRGIVATEKNIYKHDPKNYKIKKYETPLVEVKSIVVSPYNDTYVIVHANEPHRDLVLDLGAEGSEKAAEFVSVVVSEHRKLTGNTLPVSFMESDKYNNARTPKGKEGFVCTLKFEAASAADAKLIEANRTCAFKAGKNNVNTVIHHL